MSRPPITTHILDTMNGVPAKDIPVSLYRLQDDQWILLGNGQTNDDGRCETLKIIPNFTSGRYKMYFGVEEYFKTLAGDSFYPYIEVVFDVKDTDRHYHVPVLLSAFGYTTYRGS